MSRRRLRWLLVPSAIAAAVMVPVAAGQAQTAPTASLALQAGQNGQITCSGGTLSVSSVAAGSLIATCKPGSTSTTTTQPPTTTTTTTKPPTTPGTPWTIPTGKVAWQWELENALNLNSPNEMGTNDMTYLSSPAPAPQVFDIDAITNPASTTKALHVMGDKVICYVTVGAVGNFYSASQEGIPVTYYQQFMNAGDLGDPAPDNEYFLNISSLSTVSILESEIKQQCSAKGFDGVETDLDETFPGYDGTTGFSQTEAQEQTFDTTLANYIHSLGMGWIAKNLVDTGDNFATVMQPLANGLITEDCNQWSQCGQAQVYISHGKGVLNDEYNLAPSQFCPADNAAGIDGMQTDVQLDGNKRVTCA